MRRTRVGSGRHGSDVGCFEDEDPRGTSAAAGWRHVEDYWDLRIRDLLDDVASGFDETSGRIDLDQHSLIVAACGFVDGPGDVFLGDGLDGVVDDDLKNFGRGGGAKDKNCNETWIKTRNYVLFHCSQPISTIFLL